MTFDCKRPCVMDLKLGKRAYGDDATQKKKISQTLKSKKTTSWKTGIRICGCQVFSPFTTLASFPLAFFSSSPSFHSTYSATSFYELFPLFLLHCTSIQHYISCFLSRAFTMTNRINNYLAS